MVPGSTWVTMLSYTLEHNQTWHTLGLQETKLCEQNAPGPTA